MKDERIETTINRNAKIGFFICVYFLLPISILYRMLILKQDIRDFWDIVAIFFFGIFFVFFAQARKGVFAHLSFKRTWLPICIGVIIGNLTLFFGMGPIHSVFEVVAFLISMLSGMGLAIGITYLLNRRWKRKEGIEDEK